MLIANEAGKYNRFYCYDGIYATHIGMFMALVCYISALAIKRSTVKFRLFLTGQPSILNSI